MNAFQFIKDHGVEKARKVVAAYHGTPSYTFKEKTDRGYSTCQSVDLSDLKRLIESVDLQIEATEQGREAAIGTQAKNWWSSKLLMLRPIRRVLEQALKGGSDE